MVKLYTGKGDAGQTDLLGERVGKDDPRIDLMGILDETTSFIGLARAHLTTDQLRPPIVEIQRDLYAVMAELAFTDEIRPDRYVLPPERLEWLEAETDLLTEKVTIGREFVLPGDTIPGAFLDVARTVTRRAERKTVELIAAGIFANPIVPRYLNRLSSFLFVAARFEEATAGVQAQRAKQPDR